MGSSMTTWAMVNPLACSDRQGVWQRGWGKTRVKATRAGGNGEDDTDWRETGERCVALKRMDRGAGSCGAGLVARRWWRLEAGGAHRRPERGTESLPGEGARRPE
ncbi:MAG: hypothetical protein AMXMBFR80_09500 [Dehalococcoidia bacterium]